MRQLILLVPDWPVVATGTGGEPVAVCRRGRVLSCSPAARALGVRVGQRQREAEGIAPELCSRERDAPAEARAFAPIVEAVTSLTEDLELARPGLLALATRGPARYFGGEEALVALVHERVAPLIPVGGRAQVGVADTRLAAFLAARAGCLVAPGEDAAFLAPHSVLVLGRSALTETLVALGLSSLGALAGSDEGLVSARFGLEGARAWALAAGQDEQTLRYVPRHDEHVLHVPLDPPASQIEEVAFATRASAEEFLELIGAGGWRCVRFSIALSDETGESETRVWRAPRPLNAARLVERIRWQLEGWCGPLASHPPTGGIAAVEVRALELEHARGEQLDLLAPPAPVGHERAHLDRLVARAGPDGLRRAVLTGGRGPAERVLLVPWEQDAPRPRAADPWPGSFRLPSPAVVYDPPLGCALVDSLGEALLVNRRGALRRIPAHLTVAGVGTAVEDFAGPWLYEEEWWTRAARRRARLQVVTADSAAHLCVFEQGNWWLEATYD